MKREHTEAETCALNGWKVGTRLVGDEGDGRTVIELTAIGEARILAKTVSNASNRTHGESTWILACREWEIAL